MRVALLPLTLLFALAFPALADGAANKPVVIGVLAYEGRAATLDRWQPTAGYLHGRIPQYDFQILPLTHLELEYAINKQQIDFLLTNPGHYVSLEAKSGASRIATFSSHHQGQAITRFGAVIFSRIQQPIHTLAGLRGKTVAAVSEGAFGGFQLAQRELLDAKIPASELKMEWLGFPQTDIVRQVLEGKVDAGTVRTGVLESMMESEPGLRQKLAIINAKHDPQFPYLHSTRLYPEWPFARLAYTNPLLSKQVAIALLQMPEDAPAAQAAQSAGWTIPLDYSEVNGLLLALGVPPYTTPTATPSPVPLRGWLWALLLLGLVIGLLSLWAMRKFQRLQQTRANLTETLVRRNAELRQLQQALNTQTASSGQTNAPPETPAIEEGIQSRFATVTARELEILQLVAHGEPTKNIARLLDISPKTVELHRSNLLSKTAAHSSTDLVRLAVLAGLID